MRKGIIMGRLKNRIALIAILLLLGLMIGCCGDDVSAPDSESNIDIEGVYDGIMKFTQVEVVSDSDDEENYYNPQEEGDESGWLNEERKVSFTVSLDGDKMVLSAHNEEDVPTDGVGLEGTYDSANNKFTCDYSQTPGMKQVMTLSFYEEGDFIKASGERNEELVEKGWTNIISIELTKRADE